MSSFTGLEVPGTVPEISTSAAEPSGPDGGQPWVAQGSRAPAALGARVREWFLRSAALAEARRHQLNPGQRAALRAALQALELADRAVDLPEGYRAGPPLGVSLMLYQEAVWWALQAAHGAPRAPDSLAQACAEHAELLRATAGGEQQLARLRAQFLEPERHSFQALEEASQLALIADARRFASALVAHVGAPDAQVARVTRQRWLRPSLAAASVACIALALALALGSRDVAAGRTWTASSGEWGFGRTGTTDKFGNEDLLFHTHAEANPWLLVDLGAPERVRAVAVENRSTCCQERAVPLIVELSADGKSWREVARKDEVFTSWKARFRAQQARFVRLRVPRHTVLHLRRVQVLN